MNTFTKEQVNRALSEAGRITGDEHKVRVNRSLAIGTPTLLTDTADGYVRATVPSQRSGQYTVEARAGMRPDRFPPCKHIVRLERYLYVEGHGEWHGTSCTCEDYKKRRVWYESALLNRDK